MSLTACPACSGSLRPFHAQDGVPAHSCLLLASRQDAVSYPKGDIALGVWTMTATRAMHAHEHVHNGSRHVHLHSHLLGRGHDHKHAPTFVGLMHGLAGAAPAVALVPLAMFDSALGGISYLVLFAIGTAVSMSIYALFAGLVAGRATRTAASFGRAVGQLTGLSTIIIGFVWLIR